MYEPDELIAVCNKIRASTVTGLLDGELESEEKVAAEVSRFVTEMKKIPSLRLRFTYGESYRKFEVLYGYIMGQHDKMAQWVKRMFYDVTFSTITPRVAQSFALMWILSDSAKRDETKMDPFLRAHTFFTEYMYYLVRKVHSRREAVNLMCMEKDLGMHFRNLDIARAAGIAPDNDGTTAQSVSQ